MWGAEHTRFSLDENLKAQKQSPDPLHNKKTSGTFALEIKTF